MTECNNEQNMGLATWMAFTLFRNLTSSEFMAQNPSWAANILSACEEGTCNLWKLKIHYLVHKSPPLLRVLSQMTPVLTLSSCFLKIRFNIILLYISRSSRTSTSFRFFNPTMYDVFSYPLYATWLASPFLSVLSP